MQSFGATIMSGVFAFLCFALGIPLALRKVPPNRWYGYRINSYVFEDEDIWYDVNAAGGRHLLLGGLVFGIIAAISAMYIGNNPVQNTLTLVTAVLALVGIVATATSTIRFSRGLAREKGLLDGEESKRG